MVLLDYFMKYCTKRNYDDFGWLNIILEIPLEFKDYRFSLLKIFLQHAQ